LPIRELTNSNRIPELFINYKITAQSNHVKNYRFDKINLIEIKLNGMNQDYLVVALNKEKEKSHEILRRF
jgi:hypothetical protein